MIASRLGYNPMLKIGVVDWLDIIVNKLCEERSVPIDNIVLVKDGKPTEAAIGHTEKDDG